jgi:hypothetical protein
LVVLTYLLGPILALLPRTWRVLLPFYEAVEWRTAMIVSGFAESITALIAMTYWYSYSVTGWVERGIDSAISGKTPSGVTEHDIGFVALLIFATHPLTWLLGYAGVEGSVRLVGAAFTENYLGTLPLFVLEKIITKISGRGGPGAAKAAGFSQGHLSSYVGAVREKVMVARLPEVPDELCYRKNDADEILEIRACRRKEEWTPPRTVRFRDAYYRLESSSEGAPPRPFHYQLRRLAAGVPGRSVLLYSPELPLVRGKS